MPAAKQEGHLLEDGTATLYFAANGRVRSDGALVINDYAGEQLGC